jgi:Protein of unknown function (DUF4230)
MVTNLLARVVRAAATPPRRPRRGHRTLTVVAVATGVAVLVPMGIQGVDRLPGWGDPFEEQVIDRSPSALLVTLRDVAEYTAATGTFQVLVDVEHDTPYLPAVISGERTTFFAVGDVDAVVDFAGIGPERVLVSLDRRSATITLPAPELGEAVVDSEESRVVGRERGLAQRLAGVFEDNPTGDQELYLLAEEKLSSAAAESDLVMRAQENTRQMLTGLAGSLGYERVTVVFAPSAA